VTTPQERSLFRKQIAERAGVEISPGAIWALVRIDEYGFARARALAEEEGIDSERSARCSRSRASEASSPTTTAGT
jgi:hypothetical protein